MDNKYLSNTYIDSVKTLSDAIENFYQVRALLDQDNMETMADLYANSDKKISSEEFTRCLHVVEGFFNGYDIDVPERSDNV